MRARLPVVLALASIAAFAIPAALTIGSEFGDFNVVDLSTTVPCRSRTP